MKSSQIEFKYLNDKNKCKSSVISKINKLQDIFNDQSDFKNLKNEIIKFLKEKKSIIVNIQDNNYNIEEPNSESEEKRYNNENIPVKVFRKLQQPSVSLAAPHPEQALLGAAVEELSNGENNIELDGVFRKNPQPSVSQSLLGPAENPINEECDNKLYDETLPSTTFDEIIEYISVYSSDEEDLDNQYQKKKIDTQTYFIDSDSEDESIFSQKIDKNKLSKKILNNMTILELKNIMREKNLKLSEHGIPLKKQEMIKSILKNK
jgi:hypothetical protein